ncbi:MAG: methyltransferase domain-containing protein [Eudoraea sp.]|uniref:methyltransferase domain-containing protein n=1 Tax=Eudoraea sp. TaxID=1979955 RepID=UPI003C77726D
MALKERSCAVELMDTIEVDHQTLKDVFNDINKANFFLGGNSITLNGVTQLIDDHPKNNYTIVDMGCGDGTILRKLALTFRKHSASFNFIGMDLNQKALDIANANSKDYPEINYIRQDILSLQPKQFQCDILLCTLTMHHFKNPEIIVFMDHFIKLSKIGVVINDLQRSALACYLFRLFSSIFIKTKIAKSDGLISIKRGFKKKELIHLSNLFPNTEHSIRWKWAFRYLWIVNTSKLREENE